MNRFGLSDEQYAWIKKILSLYLPGTEVFVFGSRSRGDHKKYSDLDLAVRAVKAIQRKTWLEIQEQFSESTLPFKVDLIEMQKIDPDFQKAIQKDLQAF